MGTMSDSAGEVVLAYEESGRIFHLVWKDAAQGLAYPLHENQRAWIGDVFFDHLRDVVDANPTPLVEDAPFILVCHTRDFDWTAQHSTSVTPFADATALIAAGRAAVAQERSAGNFTTELWEVYGVRVRRVSPGRP